MIIPNHAINDGKEKANRFIENHKNDFCSIQSNGWNPCISIKIDHLKGYNDYMQFKEITGKIILKNDNYIGVYTKDGSITMTLPETFFYQNIRAINPSPVQQQP